MRGDQIYIRLYKFKVMIYTLLAAICTAKVYNVALDWSECQLYLSELLIGDSVIFTGYENSSTGY